MEEAAHTDTFPDLLSVTQLLNLGHEQRLDASLRTIIGKLESRPRDASLQMFLVKDGILYRRNLDPYGHDLLPVIPAHLPATVLN